MGLPIYTVFRVLCTGDWLGPGVARMWRGVHAAVVGTHPNLHSGTWTISDGVLAGTDLASAGVGNWMEGLCRRSHSW
jgi:hypothetical protein